MTWSSKDEDEFMKMQERRSNFLANRETNLERACEFFKSTPSNRYDIQQVLKKNAGVFIDALLPYRESDKNAAIV